MTIYWLVFSLFTLVSFLGLVYLHALLARQERELTSLRREVRTLSGNLSAQCASSAGMNRRLHGIESDMRDWREQREQEEVKQLHSNDQQPYGEAIYLVRHGAGARRLMDELGLSRSEAELIVRVHGIRAAA